MMFSGDSTGGVSTNTALVFSVGFSVVHLNFLFKYLNLL